MSEDGNNGGVRPVSLAMSPGPIPVRFVCGEHPNATLDLAGWGSSLATCPDCGRAWRLCGDRFGLKDCRLWEGHAGLHTSASGSQWPTQPAAPDFEAKVEYAGRPAEQWARIVDAVTRLQETSAKLREARKAMHDCPLHMPGEVTPSNPSGWMVNPARALLVAAFDAAVFAHDAAKRTFAEAAGVEL